MSVIKKEEEIQRMREGGKKLHKIRQKLLQEIKPGAIPLKIDQLAKNLIKEAGGTPSFMTVHDYQWATCINVNDMVVHGVPTNTPLQIGDVVGLDVGLLYQGFHTDTSWSKVVTGEQPVDKKVEKFLKIGELALDKAIHEAKPGNRVGHISQAIQSVIEQGGYSVVRSLVGHGVGKNLHEPPQIPGVLSRSIEKTPTLVPGMVIAIEAIYNMGRPHVVYKNEDGWTLATADGSLSGLYEETVEITDAGPKILT